MEEKFSDVSEESKVELMKKTLSAIFKSVIDNVMHEITIKQTALQLAELYLGKSVTNRLYLKKRFYNLRMVECTRLIVTWMNSTRSLLA